MKGALQSFFIEQVLEPFETPQLSLCAPSSTVKASSARDTRVDEGRTVLLPAQTSSLDVNLGTKSSVITDVPSIEI